MRAFLATPQLCPPPGGKVGNFHHSPLLSLWPRPVIEAAIDALIAELDTRDGDPDMEPSECNLDHLPDDDTVHRIDAAPLPRTNLFTLEGRCHVA